MTLGAGAGGVAHPLKPESRVSIARMPPAIRRMSGRAVSIFR
jgi:hypothetical protein